MNPVKIRLNKDYATSKYHSRGKQIVMKKGLEFPSLTEFMRYSGYGANKAYELMERKIIAQD